MYDKNIFVQGVVPVGYKRQHRPSYCRLLTKILVKIAPIVAYLTKISAKIPKISKIREISES